MVTHAFPRFEGDMAGVFIDLLARALIKRGHDLHVITPSDAGDGGLIDWHGVAVHRIRYAPQRLERLAHRGTMVEAARSPIGALTLLSLVRSLRRSIEALVKTEGLDVVHAHWWVPSGVAAWRASEKIPVPYVVTVHGTDARLLGRIPGASWLGRRVLGRAAASTAVSKFLADRVCTEVGDITITVQPMPTDTSGFVLPSHGGGGVVTIGRLSAQKRIGDLIEAMRVLRDRGTDVPLTIVGDGVERAALESRARDSGIDARFVGQVPTTELPERLGGMDVCVMPAEREGLGLAAIEALIAGVPVVVTEEGGGLLDIVGEGDYGRVVPARHPEALADAVETFLDNPSAREAAAAAGKRWRAALDPDVVAESFEGIYESVLGQIVS